MAAAPPSSVERRPCRLPSLEVLALSTTGSLACAVAASVALGVWPQIAPVTCAADERCAELDGAIDRTFHGKIAFALGILLLKEVVGLIKAVADGMRDLARTSAKSRRWLAPLLLSAILGVLICFELELFLSDGSSLAHSAHGRPVQTLRYAEWVVNVPLFIVLGACCFMGRPLKEVLPPLILTEVYMVVAWFAVVVHSVLLSIVAVVVTFVLYSLATLMMLRGVRAFWRESAPDSPGRWVKPSATMSLLALFVVYAIIYLLAVFDEIPPEVEEQTYAWLGFCCSAYMSLVSAAIRGLDLAGAGHAKARDAPASPAGDKPQLAASSSAAAAGAAAAAPAGDVEGAEAVVMPCRARGDVEPRGRRALQHLDLAQQRLLEETLRAPLTRGASSDEAPLRPACDEAPRPRAAPAAMSDAKSA